MKYRGFAYIGVLLAVVVEASLVFTYYPRNVSATSSTAAGDFPAGRMASYHDQSESNVCADKHPDQQGVTAFVNQFGLRGMRVLEVGAPSGALQDVVENYWAVVTDDKIQRCFHKPALPGSLTSLRFGNNEFDAIWSKDVLEHSANPEQTLSEMRRVLKDGGLLYLYPIWQTRVWHADGYAVRPYDELDFKGRFTKASIPIRDSVAFRSLYTFPVRLLRLFSYTWEGQPTALRYHALTPNFERQWHPDSDAMNSIDPYEAILWFKSRGDEIVNYDTSLSQFFIRTGLVLVRVHKDQPGADLRAGDLGL